MNSKVIEALRHQIEDDLVPAANLVVALSGGMDSTVLLHAVCHLRPDFPDMTVRAIHINHDLHSDATEWANHCRDFCKQLDVPFECHKVNVTLQAGQGLEAAARQARYEVFAGSVSPGEYLLTAHHQRDQLETFLLRALRGSGVRGLGGIPRLQHFGTGWLWRPILNLDRGALEEYGRLAGLTWIEDPSNSNEAMDRNYLRHRVVPLLRARWPASGETIGRAARLSRETADLLDELGAADAERIMRGESAGLAELGRLSVSRQHNVIRYILNSRGFVGPSEAQLRAGLEQLQSARFDREPVMQWAAGQVRRYRGRLYFLGFDPASASRSSPAEYCWNGRDDLEMGPIRGRLRLVPTEADQAEIAIPAGPDGLEVRFRQGGERIRETNQRHHKRLKKLFQERGILPWMRSHVPLIYSADRLLAIGNLWIAASATSALGEPGYKILWENHALITGMTDQ